MMKAVLGTPDTESDIEGLVKTLITLDLDEFAFPAGQEELWTGLLLGIQLARAGAIVENLGAINPDTVKLGLYSV